MKRVAVIGLGNIAIRHRRNLKALFPDVSLYTMSASGRVPNEDISDCDCIVTRIHDLIDAKVELVIIASPAPFHAKHAIPFIEAGIPTLIEKPVTTNSQDALLLQQAIDEYHPPVAVGYCLRYLPSTQIVKQLLSENKVGKLYNVFIQIGQYLPDWRPNKNYHDSVSANPTLGGGALLELSHELDYAQWLLGELKIEHVLLRSTDELSLAVEDIADITVTTKAGAVGHIHLDFLQRKAHRACSFIGSQGRLDWDLIENSVIFSSNKGEEILYKTPEWDKNKMYLAMLQDFIAQIDGKPHNCISLDEAKQTVLLIESIKHCENN